MCSLNYIQHLFEFYLIFQTSMDLPPDKAKLLKQYDDEKKWDIICDQVSLNKKQFPLVNDFVLHSSW